MCEGDPQENSFLSGSLVCIKFLSPIQEGGSVHARSCTCLFCPLDGENITNDHEKYETYDIDVNAGIGGSGFTAVEGGSIKMI